MRGAERVLEVFGELFPEAPIYTLVHRRGSLSPALERRDIRTSFLQRLPYGVSKYRHYLPLMPAAIESFDPSGLAARCLLPHAHALRVGTAGRLLR
jgi:hypothetical protein